jgi:hypothetical protein
MRRGRSPEILTNFRAAIGAGMHFSPPTQALSPEKCAKPTYTPSVSIERDVLKSSVNKRPCFPGWFACFDSEHLTIACPELNSFAGHLTCQSLSVGVKYIRIRGEPEGKITGGFPHD